jgi:hypothetical protein
MRSVVVLAALAAGCVKTVNLGEGTTTNRRVLESHYVGDVLRAGPASINDNDVALSVNIEGSCDVKAEVRTAQVMRQKRVGLEWIYWISGGALLALPFGSLAVLMPDPPTIFTVFGLTGVGFLAYGIYGAVRHGKVQNRELSARVDTANGREACAARTPMPASLAIGLPGGKRIDAPASASAVVVQVRDLEVADAAGAWQIDGAGLHGEWKHDDGQRDQIAAAVAHYKPRLVIDRMELPAERIMAGDRVGIRLSVKNVGGSASPQGQTLTLRGPFDDQRAQVESLAPQASTTVELAATIPVERDGNLPIRAFVTAGIDERLASLAVARKPRPSLALRCSLPEAASSWVGTRRVIEVQRKRFRATCEVANVGDADAAGVEVVVGSNGFEPAKQAVAKLAPLQTTSVTIETEPTNGAGTVDLTFVASGANMKPVKHTRKVVIR